MKWKDANAGKTRIFSLIFQPKQSVQIVLVYYSLFTPNHFFRGIATREINSPEERVHLWPYNRRFPQNIELWIHTICCLTNERLGSSGFMWVLGLCCSRMVTVNLLFLSRCEMYSTVKSHTGAFLRQCTRHTTHTHNYTYIPPHNLELLQNFYVLH